MWQTIIHYIASGITEQYGGDLINHSLITYSFRTAVAAANEVRDEDFILCEKMAV